MKVKIKSYFGDLPDYLTEGKAYKVIAGSGRYVDIIGDDGGLVCIDINDCEHLNGGKWWVEK